MIDTVEFTPEEAAQASSDLMKKWLEREAKLLLGTKIKNQECILLKFSREDARTCASLAAIQ